MKTVFALLLTLCGLHLFLPAQQWIAPTYTYDSTLNVPYGTAVNFNGSTETLLMDIFTPQCDDPQHLSRRPLAIFIHGGAFLAGSKDEASIRQLCRNYAKRGYVTAALNYRLGFVADDAAWTCNYPNYPCVFAADSAEWYRACFRAIQDVKGGIRYLVHRNAQYRIDTNNVFVAGESAGAITALGVAFMDQLSEKFPQAGALNGVPAPHSSTWTCEYNVGETFGSTVSRPDLGSIDGDIEPAPAQYILRGVGNIYGGMLSNLLPPSPAQPVWQVTPAVYSFHRPCDLVVPIDSNRVFWGLNWCFTNGYNCYAVAHTPKIYGSRTLRDWNTQNGYGITMQNEFTATTFPYSFLLGTASCTDQASNPCHAYDNFTIRETNMATFFAGLITTNPVCQPGVSRGEILPENLLRIFPNPAAGQVTLAYQGAGSGTYRLQNLLGQTLRTGTLNPGDTRLSLHDMAPGMYLLAVQTPQGHRVERLRVE